MEEASNGGEFSGIESTVRFSRNVGRVRTKQTIAVRRITFNAREVVQRTLPRMGKRMTMYLEKKEKICCLKINGKRISIFYTP